MRQAQQEISSAEFTEWLAYYQLEPFGEQLADLRHGTACALLANINRDAAARPDPYQADDFIHWTKQPEAAEETIEMHDPVAHSNLIRAALFGIAPKAPG